MFFKKRTANYYIQTLKKMSCQLHGGNKKCVKIFFTNVQECKPKITSRDQKQKNFKYSILIDKNCKKKAKKKYIYKHNKFTKL